MEDDIPIHLSLLETMKAGIEAFPIEIHSAYDGRQALNKYRTFKFDLIILDLMMPEMNGEEFLREISFSQSRAIIKIPVLILSALSKARVSNFIRDILFIEKPFDLDYFIKTIEDTLSTKKRRPVFIDVSH